MILATLRMTTPSHKRTEMVKTLRSMARKTSVQSGCLSCRLYRDENEESILMFEEVWKNQDDLDQYLRSEDFRHLLVLLEMAGEPPEIKFQTVSESAGLEVAEKAIAGKKNEEQ